MIDNELLLFDRLNAIRDTIKKYGEEKFYISFSGGKDSTILHHLVDMALPNNRIPRVYSNTGIEYLLIGKFVRSLAIFDDRFQIIKPSKPIKKTLEEIGYPFKSKHHSYMLEKYQRLGLITGVKNYIGIGDKQVNHPCPIKLKYQFTPEFKIKVSDLCCLKMKEEPLTNWAKENNKEIAITGIMPSEGGRRLKASCLTIKDKRVKFFNPLVKIDKDWEDWFIKKYDIQLCELYYPPFNFKRTGCKGCPFAIEIQHELDVMEELLPNERKQCEIIWEPIYKEYRRIGYRLRKDDKNLDK